MSLHKLTAGDGYTYLTRQVAVSDSTERGYSSLGDYYSAKGESPGVWAGKGLVSLGVSGPVTEQQMRNLFGMGIHPDAERITADLRAQGFGAPAAAAAARLGAKFPVYQGTSQWRDALTAAYAAWNTTHGRPAQQAVPEQVREEIRTELATVMFTEQHGRAPADVAELSGFLARQSRPESSAVAGFDLTFSPVKSVSAWWAVAPLDAARIIETAHKAAVEETMAWLECEAGYTRVGTRGPAQVQVRGLVTAQFTHRDSRAGDPDLHTHLAVSAKVQTLDGRWLALDARMLYRLNVAGSEFYNTALEAELHHRLGVVFAERGDADPAKRAVREVVGVDPRLVHRWSTRRHSITASRAELAKRFVARHGRVPTTVEMIALSQQANLATRDAKHPARSLAEQRATWRAEALEVLGGEAGLTVMLADTAAGRPAQPVTPSPETLASKKAAASARGDRNSPHSPPGFEPVTPALVEELAGETIAAISLGRAQWRESNLVAEALRQVRGADIHPQDTITAAHAVTAAAARLGTPIGVDPDVAAAVPAALQRSDGTSVYRMAKGQLYTCPGVVLAEHRILAAAGLGDGRAIRAAQVELACLEWAATNPGRVLNHAQHHLVHTVATSNRRLQLALAPAGTGKTTAMGVLARAWTLSGGTVVGLAPQASAAQELAAVIPHVTADTVDKLVHDLHHTPPQHWLPWMASIGPDTLAIIDEAGLAATPKLDTTIQFVLRKGGRVLLVGDDRQRAAAGAGGVLKDIETVHGAITLTEVLRFTDPLEGQASLALRDGDASVVGYYADHGRVHAVTPDTAVSQLYQAWAADTAGGVDSIMIAPTLAMVTALNAQARADRLATTGEPVGRELTLPNGDTISAGDVVITKRNKRTLAVGGADFVRNNYRWTVNHIHRDGSITATELRRRTTRTLPAWYLNEGHVRLGYAYTHASVQGLTVGSANRRKGTAHTVVTTAMTRNDLYPALTRATDATHLYVILGGDGDPHDLVKPDAVTPPTALEILTQVIGRDGTARSATTETREAAIPAWRLGHAADAYTHAVTAGAENLIGPTRMTQITAAAETVVPGVTTSPAWETLRGHLAVLAAAGADPIPRLTEAAGGRELDTALDPAAVLDYRLDPTGNHSQHAGPLPWLPAIPACLLDHPEWSDYLTGRADLIGELADLIRTDVVGWTAADAPAWALPYLSDPALLADLAVWRSAESIADTDMRPAGETPRRIAMRSRHRQLVQRAIAVAGNPADGADRWSTTLTTIMGAQNASGVVDDDYWPVLAGRLTLADTAGIPVIPLLSQAVAAGPLPAEAPAAALWWRLAPHLGSLAAVPDSHRLRPGWTAALTDTLGGPTAQRIVDDRLWPVIVAMMDAAARAGHHPAALMSSAAAMLAAARSTIGDHEFAVVLLWNLTTLTDPNPADPTTEPPHPDPHNQDLEPETEPPTGTTTPTATTTPLYESLGQERLGSVPGSTEPPDGFDDIPPESGDAESEPIDPDPSNRAHSIGRIHQVLAAAAAFYADQAASSWVPGYLTGRGLDPTSAGYAPAGWTTAVSHLRTLGFSDTELLAAGLARTSSTGSLIDHLRDRAVLPITTPDGHVAGFIGRKSPADINPHNPKYLNTPTTAVFDKSSLPYGLTVEATAKLRAGADLVIAEGPFDALAVTAADEGLVAVAPLGTALTEGQLSSIGHVAPLADRQVVVVLDSDQAGRAAAARAYRVLTSNNVTNPLTGTIDGKDPAEMLQNFGPEALRDALADRRPLADLVVDEIIGRYHVADGTVESRVNALRAAANRIAPMPWHQHLRQARRLADTLRIDKQAILENITAARIKPDPDDPLGLPHPPRVRDWQRSSPEAALAQRWHRHQQARREAAALVPLLLHMWPDHVDLARHIRQSASTVDIAAHLARTREYGEDPQRLLQQIPVDDLCGPDIDDPGAYLASKIRDIADDLTLPFVDHDTRDHVSDTLTQAWDDPHLVDTLASDPGYDHAVRAIAAAETTAIDLHDLLRQLPTRQFADHDEPADRLAFAVRTATARLHPADNDWLIAGAREVARQAWPEHPDSARTITDSAAFSLLAERMATAAQTGHDVEQTLRNLDPDALAAPGVPSPAGTAAFAFDRLIKSAGIPSWHKRLHGELTDAELTARIETDQQTVAELAARQRDHELQAEQAAEAAATGSGPAMQQAEARIAAAQAQAERLAEYMALERQWNQVAEQVRTYARAIAAAQQQRDHGERDSSRKAFQDARLDRLNAELAKAQQAAYDLAERAEQIEGVPHDQSACEQLSHRLVSIQQDQQQILESARIRDTQDVTQLRHDAEHLAEQLQDHQSTLSQLKAEHENRDHLPHRRRQLEATERISAGSTATLRSTERMIAPRNVAIQINSPTPPSPDICVGP